MNKFNESELIEEIKNHEHLYNKTHPSFANRRKKKETWQYIGALFNTTGETVKKRWQMMRDYYLLLKKNENMEVPQKSHYRYSSSGKRVKWRFYDDFKFFDNVPEFQSTLIKKRNGSETSSGSLEHEKTPIITTSYNSQRRLHNETDGTSFPALLEAEVEDFNNVAQFQSTIIKKRKVSEISSGSLEHEKTPIITISYNSQRRLDNETDSTSFPALLEAEAEDFDNVPQFQSTIIKKRKGSEISSGSLEHEKTPIITISYNSQSRLDNETDSTSFPALVEAEAEDFENSSAWNQETDSTTNVLIPCSEDIKVENACESSNENPIEAPTNSAYGTTADLELKNNSSSLEDVIKVAATSIVETCARLKSQQNDPISMFFMALSEDVKAANLPKNKLLHLKRKVSNMVYDELEYREES